MHGEEQHVIIFCQLQQTHSQQWAHRQIEGPSRFFSGQSARLCLPLCLTQLQQVDLSDYHRLLFLDHLSWPPIHTHETRPQRFVSPADLVERLCQRRDVEPATKTNRRWHVVCPSAGLQLIQKP